MKKRKSEGKTKKRSIAFQGFTRARKDWRKISKTNKYDGQLAARLGAMFANIAQKDKEDLEEISGELELADEDDKVPYTLHQRWKMF